MAITVGDIIAAKDVRERLKGNLISIKEHLDEIGNEGIKIGFFGGPDFAGTIIPSVQPVVSHQQDFLSNFASLSASFQNLSVQFDVVPGKIIALSGFYDYALSCHALASYIRHTVYILLGSNIDGPLVYDNASYLREIPTMSALIPGEISGDFRTNWAENYQQNLSNVEAYLSGKDSENGQFWQDKDYGNGCLCSYVNFNDFHNYAAKMHISAICSADPASNMLNLLKDINNDLGQTISCLYYWNNGESRPLEKISVIYDVDRFGSLIKMEDGSQISGSVVFPMFQYSYHTVHTLAEIGWKLNNPNLTMDSWDVKNSNESWEIGSSHQILSTVTLIPNLEGSTKINADIYKYWFDNSKYGSTGTSITGYRITPSTGNIQEIGGVITVSGLSGFSYVEIESLQCAINERDHSHSFEVWIEDLTNSANNRMLIRYKPAWQVHGWTPRFNDVINSKFPRENYAGRIRLDINSSGEIRFRMVAKFEKIKDAAREFFLMNVDGVITNGGIHNFIVYA